MPTRLFVTGFGAFGQFDTNPTSLLAPALGAPHAILPVTYADADAFLASFDADNYDALLMLGVSAKAESILLETTARNRIGTTPDASGIVAGPMPINSSGPPQLNATLWTEAHHHAHSTSQDAGDYLCNYLFYRGLEAHPRLRIGFVHVPPFSVISETLQQNALRELSGSL
jgi:pyrrolidone-carboxylate peptidase